MATERSLISHKSPKNLPESNNKAFDAGSVWARQVDAFTYFHCSKTALRSPPAHLRPPPLTPFRRLIFWKNFHFGIPTISNIDLIVVYLLYSPVTSMTLLQKNNVYHDFKYCKTIHVYIIIMYIHSMLNKLALCQRSY